MKNKINKYPLLFYFLSAYLISWVLWMPLYLPYFGIKGLPQWRYHHASGALGPIAAAFLLTGYEQGQKGIRELIRRMFRWKVSLLWHAVAFLFPLLLLAISAFLHALLTRQSLDLNGAGVSREFPQFGALEFLLYNIITFGYGEETGWRGYALPRLQRKYTALQATILLTIGWALWHIPLFFYRPGYLQMEISGIIGWFFSLLMGSILLTWLYNSTRGSILICAIFHAIIDIVFTSDVASQEVIGYTGVFITVWGILVLLLAKPKHLSDKPRQTLAQTEDEIYT